jgi:spoIIIJ-associated protein
MTKEQEVVKTLKSMISLLGLKAELSSKETDRGIIVGLSSDEPGRLIGRNGQTIDALQQLTNKMLRRFESNNCPPIILDVEGYKEARRERRANNRKGTSKPKNDENSNNDIVESPKAKRVTSHDIKDAPEDDVIVVDKVEAPIMDKKPLQAESTQEVVTSEIAGDKHKMAVDDLSARENRTRTQSRKPRADREPQKMDQNREETLIQQAKDGAKEAKRWGEEVTLPLMNAAERRMVHLALEDDQDIITESSSTSIKGRKRVIIKAK